MIKYDIIRPFQGGIGRCGSIHYPDAFVSLEDQAVLDFVLEATQLSQEMVVIGGWNGKRLSDLEATTLRNDGSGQKFSCKSLTKPHKALDAHVAQAVTDGTLISCGGWGNMRDCYIYSVATNSWSKAPFLLNEGRAYAYSVLLDNGDFMVLGGKDDNDIRLSTTEILPQHGDMFHYGSEMPYAAEDTCALMVNSTHLFLAGGNNGTHTFAYAYLYNLEETEWINVANMNKPRQSFACGLVNGFHIIVAGGYNNGPLESVEIFSLEFMKWSKGPDLPIKKAGMAAVQLKDTFVIIGGAHEEGDGDWVYHGDIYKFNETSYTWVERPENLENPRSDSGGPRLCN